MAYVTTNEFKQGLKVEVEGQPYIIVANEFVKPGKGQAFNRVRLKHLMTGRVVERTVKSGDKFELADVVEATMRMLYKEPDGVVFMDDKSFDQVKIANQNIGETMSWLMEDILYEIIFYKGEPVSVVPPTFMEMEIVDTSPGIRGDTSGRVLKPAVVASGASVQVPIFIDKGEKIKIDTRNGEYVSRASA